MAKRWKLFEDELATHGPSPGYIPSPGVSFSIRVPHGFREDRDEPRLLKIAAKYDLELGESYYGKGWGTQQRFAWFTYTSETNANQFYSRTGTYTRRERSSHSMPHCLNRSARRNKAAGRKWCLHARVKDRANEEWDWLDARLEHFGGLLIGHGLSGDTAGEGEDHLIFTLPKLFNEKRDQIKIRKLTKTRGLVWIGCFAENGRNHGLWVAPEKGMTIPNALRLLDNKKTPAGPDREKST